MGARTTAREAALQMLYALEASGNPVDMVVRDFWAEMPGDAEGRSYADALVRGVAESLEQVDALLRGASRNWRLERMTRVDRNLLRLGTYEILAYREIPRAVILDEAVELAKRFGSAESGAFVNGVLDRIADECGHGGSEASPEPNRSPTGAADRDRGEG
jgi:N utilization substance protein B